MKSPPHFWLLKSEPDTYSIDHLKAEKKTAWSGIRNYQARNNILSMHVGDLCLFYHSSTEIKGVYGIARVASKPYPDPTQFEKKSPYYDAKSTPDKPQWWTVDVAFVKRFKVPVTLGTMKLDSQLDGMVLWRASRLSVQPVSEKHFTHLIQNT